MEEKLNCVLILSLKQMALRRVLVALFHDPCIWGMIARLKFKPDILSDYMSNVYPISQSKNKVLQAVEDKMSKLQLPKLYEKENFPFLMAFWTEIMTWERIHEQYFSYSISSPGAHLQKLCWTTAGTVDYRKTAEELVQFDALDIEKRFELACLYCLEDYIPLLWEGLPDENKKFLSSYNVFSQVRTPHRKSFLLYILREHLKYDYITFGSNLFEITALSGNKTLTEYCFSNLTKEQREFCLVPAAKKVIMHRDTNTRFDFRKVKDSDVACYLLSLMSPEEQMGILQELPCEILRCLLDWPRQDVFLSTADLIWTFLPESKYDQLLTTICKSILASRYYFPDILQNFFLRSPREFRKRFVDREIQKGSFLSLFFMYEDKETMKVVFRMVDAADRERIVTSERCLFNLFLEAKSRWHMVEDFLRAVTLTEEVKRTLKESFIEIALSLERIWKSGAKRKYPIPIDLIRENFKRFLDFLEKTDASAKITGISEDEALTKAKKLL